MGKAYYNDKQVRLNELSKYIDKYGCVDGLYTNNNQLYHAFKRYKHSIVDALIEIGYQNIHDVMKRKPNGYYNDFENLKNDIEYLIKYLGKFPTVSEIHNELNIENRQIEKFGGIYNIKRMLNYNDESDLRDISGFYNSSSYEYIVAMYLINNNINYKREQSPFPKYEGDFRSDFMIECIDGEKTYVEVWGYAKSDNPQYFDVKKKKLELYDKYNLKLISIEKDIFISNNKIKINKILSEIFCNFINIETVSYENNIFPTSKMTDEEILKEILKFSNDKNILPDVPTLKEHGKYPLYNEILKRYGSYYIFADKYNKINTRHDIGYWTKDKIYECFREINKDGLDITRKNISKYEKYSGINDAIVKNGGLVTWKLEYFYDEDLLLSQTEYIWLCNVSNNTGTNIKNRVTFEQQYKAKEILQKLSN